MWLGIGGNIKINKGWVSWPCHLDVTDTTGKLICNRAAAVRGQGLIKPVTSEDGLYGMYVCIMYVCMYYECMCVCMYICMGMHVYMCVFIYVGV